MADDDHGDAERPQAASPGSRRRAPPTIDLKQSEYSSNASESSASGDDAPASSGPDAAQAANSARDNSSARMSDSQSGKDASRRGAARAGSIATGAGAGALAALIIVGAAWGIGLFSAPPPAPPPAASAGDIVARLTRLEQIATAARPEEPAPADPVLPARVSALEQSSQTARDQLVALRRQVDTLSSALVEIKARPDVASGTAGPGNGVALAPLQTRLDALERTLQDVQTRVQSDGVASKADNAPPPDPLADRRLRSFALALLLDARMQAGAPYQSELASLKAAMPLQLSADALAGLERFAVSGLPSQVTLAGELRRALNAPSPAVPQEDMPAAPEESLGLFDRLSKQAAKLVRIERADTPAMHDRPAIPPALRQAASQDNVDGALAIVQNDEPVPAALRPVLQQWADKARASRAARDAAQDILHAAAAPFRTATPGSP